MFTQTKRAPWIIGAGVGCLVICLGLAGLSGGAYWWLAPQSRGASATPTPTRMATPGITLLPTVRPTKVVAPIPRDKATCEAQGGRWGRIGLGPKDECNLPTQDAGTVCADASECEGTCLADLPQAERDRLMRGKEVIATLGKCSPWRITVGCVAIVQGGTVNAIICID